MYPTTLNNLQHDWHFKTTPHVYAITSVSQCRPLIITARPGPGRTKHQKVASTKHRHITEFQERVLHLGTQLEARRRLLDTASTAYQAHNNAKMSPLTCGSLTLFVLVTSGFRLAWTARILLVPFPAYSHVDPLLVLGDILATRGHTVSILLPSLYQHTADVKASAPKVKVVEYQVKAWSWHAAVHGGGLDAAKDYFDYVTQTTELQDIRAKRDGHRVLCEELMSSKVVSHLAANDLVVVDAHPLTRCQYAVPYKHGLPYVSYQQPYDAWITWSACPASYVPSFLVSTLTDRMTLWQRTVNAWTELYWYLGDHLPFAGTDFVARFVPDRPPIDFLELARRTRLWISDTNPLVDYPRPVTSNEFFAGWALVPEVRRSTRHLDTWIAGTNFTGDGLIVVVLDRDIALPARVVVALLAAFNTLRTYHIIWQYSGEVTTPANVKVVPYVPLTELVSRPETRVLITSGDVLHQNTALYYGIPVLCVPLRPAQRRNALRTEDHKHGQVVRPEVLTAKTLIRTLKVLLFNATYREHLEEPSRIMKLMRPGAREALAQWMELSLKSDLDALKPYSMQMAWYAHAMVDVLFIAALVFGGLAFLVTNSAILGLRWLKDVYKSGFHSTGLGPTGEHKPAKVVAPSTAVSPLNKGQGAAASSPTTPGLGKPLIPNKPFKAY